MKAGIIVSSEVNPERRPSDTRFRPLTTKSKSWIYMLDDYALFLFFYFLTKIKLICFCLLGLIRGNAQGTQSKQTIPAAMEHLQRVAALGPGDPEEGTGGSCHSRPGTTGLC